MSKRKKLLIAVFLVYIFIVLWLTLIDRQWGERRAMLMPFWEMRELITTDRKLYWSQQIGCNILILMPRGFLLPCLHRKFRKIGIIFLIALVFSIFIETTQYFTGRGLCEFDDVFHNTLGACIGFIIWKKLSH